MSGEAITDERQRPQINTGAARRAARSYASVDSNHGWHGRPEGSEKAAEYGGQIQATAGRRWLAIKFSASAAAIKAEDLARCR